MKLALTIGSTDTHILYQVEGPTGTAGKSLNLARDGDETRVSALVRGLKTINWRKQLRRIFGEVPAGEKVWISVLAESELLQAGAYLAGLDTEPAGLSEDTIELWKLLRHFDVTWRRVSDEQLVAIRAWAGLHIAADRTVAA